MLYLVKTAGYGFMKKHINIFKDKLKAIDINRLPGAILLMVATVIITAVVQNIFWIYQDNRQLKQDLHQNQIQIISDLIDISIEMEAIRDKVYWNDYNRELITALLDNTEYFHFSENYVQSEKNLEESLKNRDSLAMQYRDEYEQSISSFFSALLKSELYFSVSRNTVQSLKKKQSESFSFDFEFIDEQINKTKQEQSKADFNVLSQQLETIAQEKYNMDFDDAVFKYVTELLSQIE